MAIRFRNIGTVPPVLGESCKEAGLLLDQIVEHIAVDIAVGADYLPGGLGVGDSEVVFFFYSSFPNLTV